MSVKNSKRYMKKFAYVIPFAVITMTHIEADIVFF